MLSEQQLDEVINVLNRDQRDQWLKIFIADFIAQTDPCEPEEISEYVKNNEGLQAIRDNDAELVEEEPDGKQDWSQD